MKLVLDTNTVIQCISHRSRYHELWRSLIDGRNQLCVTNEILSEYAEILEQKTTSTFASLAVNVIINNPNTLFVTPYYKFDIIKEDPDDNKFVDCAIAANAHFVVTDDHHFDVLQNLNFPRVNIIKLDAMMCNL